MMRISLPFCLLIFAALRCGALAGEPSGGTKIVHPADGAVMVWVPGGPFIMGIDPDQGDAIAHALNFKDAAAIWAGEAYPRHTVELPGFFIDQCEVTVARWQRYITETGSTPLPHETTRHFGNPDAQQLPAGAITWSNACAYAAWAGKALPGEAQWEKAARGTDGRLFPWGNTPPHPKHGHFGGKLYTNVGSFPAGASPYGCLDMLGNQYEWTADRKTLYANNPLVATDPHGAQIISWANGIDVVARGGSWYHGTSGFYAAKRFGLAPNETYYHIGFRTIWMPPPGYFDSPEYTKALKAAQALAPPVAE